MNARIRYLILLGLAGLAACSSDDPTSPDGPADTTAPAPVADLRVLSATGSTVTLVWTATGDDGTEGTAASWEVRHADWPADPAGWEDWAPAGGGTVPGAAGATLSRTVPGLTSDTVRVFRLVAVDEAGNRSDPSNPVVATVARAHDTTPPGAVADLATWSVVDQALTVSWRAPGDDGPIGAIAGWELRWADTPLDASSWDAAAVVATGDGSPSGTRLFATLDDLAPGAVHHFAVRSRDETGAWSALSNLLATDMAPRRTWHVTADGQGPVATIQAAINRAKPGDTVLVGPGRYTWSSQDSGSFGTSDWGMIVFWRDVQGFTVRSEAGPATTIIDAERQSRGMYVMGYNDGIVIEGFTFTGGDARSSPYGLQYGGGGVLHLTSPVLRDCVFVDNIGIGGGGIANVGQNEAVFEGCRFEANRADIGGGYYGGGSIPRSVIRDCEFIANRATITGAGAVIDSQAVDIIGCLFAENVSDDAAGALAVYRNHPSNLIDCTMVGNMARRTGGIRLRSVANLTVSGTVVAFNGDDPLFADTNSELSLGCSIVYGDDQAGDLPESVVDLGGTLLTDPLLDLAGGSYRPRSASPCLPANRSGDGCGVIGAVR